MSALAIVCAISPPIVPAPTTAALKTNMNLFLSVSDCPRESTRSPEQQPPGGRAARLCPGDHGRDSPGERSAVSRYLVEGLRAPGRPRRDGGFEGGADARHRCPKAGRMALRAGAPAVLPRQL